MVDRSRKEIVCIQYILDDSIRLVASSLNDYSKVISK